MKHAILALILSIMSFAAYARCPDGSHYVCDRATGICYCSRTY